MYIPSITSLKCQIVSQTYTETSVLMIIFFIFLYLVFEINNPLEGRRAKLYLKSQSDKQKRFHQSCELVSG